MPRSLKLILGLTAAVLSFVFVTQPVSASSPKSKHDHKLKGDDRILHALNRFTFGPGPDDVAAVKKIGLKRWFDQQLDPAAINDSALFTRLDAFPAMKLPQDVLMERFPPPEIIRQMERNAAPLPVDPVERVIYADQLAFYKLAQARRAARENASLTPADSPVMSVEAKMNTLPDNIMNPDAAPTPNHVEQLYTDADAVSILNLPPDERMARILAMSPQQLIAFRQSLSRREVAQVTLGLKPEQKEILTALPNSTRLINMELLQSRLLRDIYSQRQLEAVMTDFWLNHFNIDLHKNQNEPYLLATFERDVVRPHALGKFEDLLVAVAQSPAMLVYLDNWESLGPDSLAAQRTERAQQRNPKAKVRPAGLNENYARELMELHTLGVNGGYTQADIIQVARVFSGWTIDRPLLGADYRFEPNRHEPGTKLVLGKTIQPGGEDEGREVLHMLATSPATARFISTKLAVRFVSDDPPPALIDRMTKTFLESDGDMKAVLRSLFNSREFWMASVAHAKIKTPLEFVVSTARAVNLQVDSAQPLVQSLDRLGMPLYGMQTPNGYSWSSDHWVSTGALVNRMNLALQLTSGNMPDVHTDLVSFLPSNDNSADEAREARLEILLLGQPAGQHTHATVLQQFHEATLQQQAAKAFPLKASVSVNLSSPTAVPSLDRETAVMAGLLLGSPEFQHR